MLSEDESNNYLTASEQTDFGASNLSFTSTPEASSSADGLTDNPISENNNLQLSDQMSEIDMDINAIFSHKLSTDLESQSQLMDNDRH